MYKRHIIELLGSAIEESYDAEEIYEMLNRWKLLRVEEE